MKIKAIHVLGSWDQGCTHINICVPLQAKTSLATYFHVRTGQNPCKFNHYKFPTKYIFHSLYSVWARTNLTVVLWSSGKNTLISEVPGLVEGTAEREGCRGGCCWLGELGT